MPLLALQYSISRSLEYFFFFMPALLFAAYALFCAARAPGTRRELGNALRSMHAHNPKVAKSKWDFSLSLNRGFMQPVAIADADVQDCPFKRITIRLCRHPSFLLSENTMLFSMEAEIPAKLDSGAILRFPIREEETPMFVSSAKPSDEVSLDQLSMRLNSDSALMARISSVSPSRLELLPRAGSALIRMQFRSSSPDISDAAYIMGAIASSAVSGAGSV